VVDVVTEDVTEMLAVSGIVMDSIEDEELGIINVVIEGATEILVQVDDVSKDRVVAIVSEEEAIVDGEAEESVDEESTDGAVTAKVDTEDVLATLLEEFNTIDVPGVGLDDDASVLYIWSRTGPPQYSFSYSTLLIVLSSNRGRLLTSPLQSMVQPLVVRTLPGRGLFPQ
jgi:hypothetical protein